MFQIKHNHCEGWYQALYMESNGTVRKSAKFDSQKKAIEAIYYFREHNMFRSEREEEPEETINICEQCGQPYPQ